MKLTVSIITATVLTLGSVGTINAATFSAKGYGCKLSGCNITESRTHEICTMATCDEIGAHTHDGVIYCRNTCPNYCGDINNNFGIGRRTCNKLIRGNNKTGNERNRENKSIK